MNGSAEKNEEPGPSKKRRKKKRGICGGKLAEED
jgi:hypothetical protein